MGTLKGGVCYFILSNFIFESNNSTLRHKTFQLLHFLTTHTTSSPTANIKYTESEEWIYWSFIFMQKIGMKTMNKTRFGVWSVLQFGIAKFGRMLLDIIPSTLWWWVIRSITRVIRRFHTLIFDFFLSFWFRTAFLWSEHCSFSNWSKYLTESTSIFGYTFVR